MLVVCVCYHYVTVCFNLLKDELEEGGGISSDDDDIMSNKRKTMPAKPQQNKV